ncbi:MAG: hypothetical protein K8S13_03665 [Desulfobacula sp.]|uniref:pre-toxin TG domain-containing protein n=1 Tax=Desulfobacula sp. TaxID=2593537 RepID=UPI0025BB6DDE|nr:pre-toxin TG domain-containing protein [Desulfobacula sp.]MCD4718942.1 hypothetical protein [Desulfobacula sp.]
MRIGFSILAAIIVVTLLFPCPTKIFAENETKNKSSLRQLEADRQQLLIDVRQFKHKVREELKLSALRERNRLISESGALESTFSKNKFNVIKDRAEWVALAFGGDPDIMGRYFHLASLIIAKVEPGETLKESYGIAHKSDLERNQSVAQFRQGLLENVSIAYLRYLLMEDPVQGAVDFRAYTNALRNLQVAEQFRTQAQSMELEADQQLARDLASGVPLLGDALDVIGIVTGEDALTGEKLSNTQMAVDTLLLLAPEALEAFFVGKPAFIKDLQGLSKKIDDMDFSALKKFSAALEKTPDQIKAISKKIQAAAEARKQAALSKKVEALKAAKRQKAKQLAKKMDEEVIKNIKSVDNPAKLQKKVEIWQAAESQGKKRIQKFADMVPENTIPGVYNPELLDAYQAIRKDKRALNQIQNTEFQEIREQMQKLEDKLYSHVDVDGNFTLGRVDVDAIDAIKKDFIRKADPETLSRLKSKPPKDLLPDEIVLLKKEAARERMIADVVRHGAKNGAGQTSEYLGKVLDFDNLKITVFNATNKPPEIGKIGFDRDITYQVEIPMQTPVLKNPTTGRIEVVKIPAKKVDIPAELVEEYYHKSLYKHLNPDKPLPGRDQIKEFGQKMDHQVTDALHKDAYRMDYGREKYDLDEISDFFKDPTLLTKQGMRVEDFADTVTFKSKHWFELAEKTDDAGTAMAQVAEGMRQASKQKENYMEMLFDYYGLSAQKAMDPRLQKGMHIFDMVREGRLSVPEADAALKAISMDKNEVVEKFGQYFESIIKLNKKQVQKIKASGKAGGTIQ